MSKQFVFQTGRFTENKVVLLNDQSHPPFFDWFNLGTRIQSLAPAADNYLSRISSIQVLPNYAYSELGNRLTVILTGQNPLLRRCTHSLGLPWDINSSIEEGPEIDGVRDGHEVSITWYTNRPSSSVLRVALCDMDLSANGYIIQIGLIDLPQAR